MIEKWWNEEWQLKKRKCQKEKRSFRAGKVGKKMLDEIGRSLKCIRDRKTQYAEELVKKIESCKNEKELSKITKKCREGVSNKIKKEEWYEFFKII